MLINIRSVQENTRLLKKTLLILLLFPKVSKLTAIFRLIVNDIDAIVTGFTNGISYDSGTKRPTGR